jgi:hypothetical protein
MGRVSYREGMSELDAIFGGGAEHAHKQSQLEKILPAPAPISADPHDATGKVEGVDIPTIGLPGEAIVYEPFRLRKPDDVDE